MLPSLAVHAFGGLGIRTSVPALYHASRLLSLPIPAREFCSSSDPSSDNGGGASSKGSSLVASRSSRPTQAPLCRLTGLCSRTDVGIINTNMRCPSCIRDQSGGCKTLFPAISIQATVKLMHSAAAAASAHGLQPPCTANAGSAGAASGSSFVNSSSSSSSTGSSAAGHSTCSSAVSTAAAKAAGAAHIGGSGYSTTTYGAQPALAGLQLDDVVQYGAYGKAAPAQPPAHHNPHYADHHSPLHVLWAWVMRAQGRLKGISRKVILRTLNKRVIRQVARRATIGIPIVGFFFVSRLLLRDFTRVCKEAAAGRTRIAGLFALAFVCDAVDLAASAINICGLLHSNFGVGVGLASEVLALADRGAIPVAVTSFTAGVTGELLTVLREEREAEAAEAEAAAQAAAAEAEAAVAKAMAAEAAGGTDAGAGMPEPSVESVGATAGGGACIR